MVEKRLCPSCKKEVPPGATHCLECGEPVVLLLPAQITEPVPEDLFVKTDAMPEKRIPDLERADGIALVVRGSEDPILVAEEDFIIGRYDPDSSQPTVDLSLYNAGSLGVSRRHARIQLQNDIYLIEDLNSTNGTWINQVRLPAGKKQGLPNGATLQFGQMVLYFYSSSVEAVRSVEEHIRFKSTAATRLTPAYLATRIGPYLTALADVQAVCDEMMKRSPVVVEIGAINADSPQLISVRLTGARDALKLAKGHLVLWRSEQSVKIDRLQSLKQSQGQSAAAPASAGNSASATPGTVDEAAQKLSQELRQAELKLADDFLRALAPQKTDTDRKPFVEKLLKPLHMLVFSPLVVLASTDSDPQ